MAGRLEVKRCAFVGSDLVVVPRRCGVAVDDRGDLNGAVVLENGNRQAAVVVVERHDRVVHDDTVLACRSERQLHLDGREAAGASFGFDAGTCFQVHLTTRPGVGVNAEGVGRLRGIAPSGYAIEHVRCGLLDDGDGFGDAECCRGCVLGCDSGCGRQCDKCGDGHDGQRGSPWSLHWSSSVRAVRHAPDRPVDALRVCRPRSGHVNSALAAVLVVLTRTVAGRGCADLVRRQWSTVSVQGFAVAIRTG